MSKKNIVFLLYLFYLSLSAWCAHAGEIVSAAKNIPALIKELSDPKPPVRKNAAIRLGEQFRAESTDQENTQTKEQAVRALLSAGHDDNGEVRRSAVKSLGIIHDETSLPGLRALLAAEKDPRVQIALINTLGSFKDGESEKRITGFMNNNDLPIRLAALRALGHIGTKTAYTVIINHVNDPIEAMRIVAADLCAQNGLDDSIPRLMENCTHAVPEVRISAIRAIGVLGNDEHINFLKKSARKEKDEDIQRTITGAIEEIEKRSSGE